MSEAKEHDLSQEEETNKEISQLQAESLTATPSVLHPPAGDFLETLPIGKTSVENDKDSDGEVPGVAKLENGSEAMDEEREEESSEEVKEEKEMKVEGEVAPVEDPNPVAVPGSDLFLEGEDSGDEDEQAAFMLELERFHIEHNLEYKPPKFYGKGLNCLK